MYLLSRMAIGPHSRTNSEDKFFGCEGVVCTNRDFYDRN